MILEVAADARQIVDHGDAVWPERVARTDPRQHEELGRVDRAGAEDDLALGADSPRLGAVGDLDSGRAAALQRDAPHHAIGGDRQIGPMPDRAQEGGGGGAALAPPDGEVVAPETLLLRHAPRYAPAASFERLSATAASRCSTKANPAYPLATMSSHVRT